VMRRVCDELTGRRLPETGAVTAPRHAASVSSTRRPEYSSRHLFLSTITLKLRLIRTVFMNARIKAAARANISAQVP